ncbi:hypothetical protein [Streptomyces sp. NPDC096351]|uniref:hypothetical protein n=1 Tax=Streptomyces sp. NPDC096351 TaxID=3366087 RepID=UPI00380B78FC
MDAAVRAWLTSRLGTSTDQNDLDNRYARLGTARAVAIEVLYERRAALITDQPATLAVTGVVSLSYAENIKAIERLIAQLESGEPPAPDDPGAGECDGVPDGYGVIQLIPRPRR